MACAVTLGERKDNEPLAATLIRDAASKVEDISRQAGMLEGQTTPEEPDLETLRAWSSAIPGLIRCGKAVKPSAHEIVLDDGLQVFNYINRCLPTPNDGQLIQQTREIFQVILSADQLTDLDAALLSEWRAATQGQGQRTADSGADIGKKTLPENPRVVELARRIRTDKTGAKRKQIALEFTEGDETEAASLLKQLQPSRFGHLLK